MPGPETEPRYRPSPKAVEILCERLQHMGVSISEPAASRLLETVLAIEGPRLDGQARNALQASVEAIKRAAEDALNTLQGRPPTPPRRDYELSFPPASDFQDLDAEDPADDEPRPVFRRRRGR